MKLLRLVFVLVLVLTGCNHNGTTKQQFKDKTTYNVSDVSNKTNNGELLVKNMAVREQDMDKLRKSHQEMQFHLLQ